MVRGRLDDEAYDALLQLGDHLAGALGRRVVVGY